MITKMARRKKKAKRAVKKRKDADKELAGYIKETADMGFSIGQIRKKLADVGHSIEDIEPAIEHHLELEEKEKLLQKNHRRKGSGVSPRKEREIETSSKKKAHFAFLIALAVVVVLFIGINYYLSGYEKSIVDTIPSEDEYAFEEFQSKTEQDCISIASTYERNWCLYGIARYNEDHSSCLSITQPDLKNFCIAVLTKDNSICNDIIFGRIREQCFEEAV